MSSLKTNLQRIGIFSTLVLIAFLFSTCKKVPISGRKQVNLIPKAQVFGMSYTQYDEFLSSSNRVDDSDERSQMVKRVGNNIAQSVEKYFKDKKQLSRISGFEWDFNLVDDPTVNAWCMPGGKVVFYTGILPITKDELGLAVVMGHEVAHAVAEHGNERMSQQIVVQAGGVGLSVLMQEKPEIAQGIFLSSYGATSTLGVLKFSRTHESEADMLGLVFMAMAGYDPSAAIDFWKRMAALSEGAEPPQFISTHPSNATRIKDIEAFLPEALKYYNPK